MSGYGIQIHATGLAEMIDALRRLRTEGIPRAQAELDAALDRTAEVSHDLAHVHEGTLKASQSHSSDHSPSRWEGTIAYGAQGAEWEMQRGGDHAEFIDALAALSEHDFEEAMDSAFRNL